MWRIKPESIHMIYESTEQFILDVLEWACQNPAISSDKSAIVNSVSNMRLKKVVSRCSLLRGKMFFLSNSGYAETIKKAYLHTTQNYERILHGLTQFKRLDTSVIEVVYEMFNYFYYNLIDTKIFWEQYGKSESLTKDLYRKKVGSKREYCPYCDFNSIVSEKASNTDHFFPISVHPILGVFWKNLIVSCLPCNLSIKNDVHPKLPILHPYYDQPAEYFNFNFDESNMTITVTKKIKNTSDSKRIKNYLNLFRIQETYATSWKYVKRIEKGIMKRVRKRLSRSDNLEDLVEIFLDEINDLQKDLNIDRGMVERTKLLIDFCEFLKYKVIFIIGSIDEESNPKDSLKLLLGKP